MLAQLSSKASFSARFRPTLRVKSVTKAKHAKSSLYAQKIALFSPIPCIRATLGHEAAKNILRTSIFIQKRGHAGCGMPHAGDEVPGVGMERELRAHLNVTHLNIVDTSGNGSFYYVEIESPDFVGKTTVACHKLVQGIIAHQIQHIHGLQLKTRAPKPE